MQGRVLSIAGSDSGGGAGIQADIKTITKLGGYAATAVTCVTVQNTQGVRAVHAVPADIVYDQIIAVLEDIGADTIKMGMLLNSDIIKAVHQAITDHQFQGAIIIDPVMVATSGDRLLEEDAVKAYHDLLLPIASLITPNIPELSILADCEITTVDGMINAAKKMITQGVSAVFAKGGHLLIDQAVVYNRYIDTDQTFAVDTPRIQSHHTHGTGCTLSSALATGIALGLDIKTASRQAVDFVASGIKHAPKLGQGCGPLGHQYIKS